MRRHSPAHTRRLRHSPGALSGSINAWDPNIQPFLKRGKLITYVGARDLLIPDPVTATRLMLATARTRPLRRSDSVGYYAPLP